jgi:hypothetical protein
LDGAGFSELNAQNPQLLPIHELGRLGGAFGRQIGLFEDVESISSLITMDEGREHARGKPLTAK